MNLFYIFSANPKFGPHRGSVLMARCQLCGITSPSISKAFIGYCGLRKKQDGWLTGAYTTKAKLSWYHDPLPTNCNES
jgi:hypothetical protein